MTPIRHLPAFIAVLLLLSACGENDVVYSDFRNLTQDGWDRMDVLSFDPCPFDSAIDGNSHEIEIILRHTDATPCDSIWIAVEETSFGATIHRDTIPMALSNAKGEWLGKGAHGIYETSYILRSYKRLPSGYQITLSHAMKNEHVAGIINAGIRMIRLKNNTND